MKHKIFPLMMLMAGAALVGLTACEDDNDSNPTIQQPDGFDLYGPAHASTIIDIEQSKTATFDLVWSRANYGYPSNTTYTVQVSPVGTFTTTPAQAAADETLTADYFNLGSSTSLGATYTYKQLNDGLLSIYDWQSEEEVPASMQLTLRVVASVVGTHQVASNTATMLVGPYYEILVAADPQIWYLVGSCIGDGTWGNDGDANVGKSLFPMRTVEGATYDKKTGEGPLEFSGYFPAGTGFKLIMTPGDWAEQVGGSFAAPERNEGGSGNLSFSTDGFYKITFNPTDNSLETEALEGSYPVYDIVMSGSFNGWGDTPMTAFTTAAGVENHLWTADIAFDEDQEVKFKIAGSWDVNWGEPDGAFPSGIGLQDNPNIQVPAGQYLVLFNDIDGSYQFIEKK